MGINRLAKLIIDSIFDLLNLLEAYFQEPQQSES